MNIYSHSYSVILDNMDLNEYRLRPIAAIMYIQDAFARFTATKSMAAYDLFPKNIYWIVGEFNIDFVNLLPYWSEEIKIEVWFSELSKLKIYTDFNIYSNNTLFAKGNACWFLIDMETKRPIKTDTFSDRIEVRNELVSGEHKKSIQHETTEKISEISHIINLSDLDFNKHVNNKSYINIAEMTMDNEFKKSHTIKNMNIKFIKETFLNDALTCATYKTNSEETFVHKIEKDGETVCQISTSWTNAKENLPILEADLNVKKEALINA
ncbi:hypothetical protein IJS77_02645 [bacterium]|nr:hypothetical protein [bacterium]